MAERQDGDATAESNTAGSADHSKRANRGADFYLYVFKVKPCFRTYPHCWSSCPYVHPGEKARRRDPKRYAYSPVPCPHDSKGGERCPQGDDCNFTHNVYEFHLHPMRFRTALCQDRQSCNRQLCFFAHSAEELRRPSMAAELPSEVPPSQNTAHDLVAAATQMTAGAGLYAWPAVPDAGLPTALTDLRAEQGAVMGGWALPAGQGGTAAAAGSRLFGAVSQVEPADSDVLTVLTNFRQRRSAAAAAAVAGAGSRVSEDAVAGTFGNAAGVATAAAAAEAVPSYASSVYRTGQHLGYHVGGYGGSLGPQMVLLDRQQQLQQQQQQQQGEPVPALWPSTGFGEASGDAGQDAAGLPPLMYTAVPSGGTSLLSPDCHQEYLLQQQYLPPQHRHRAPHQQLQQAANQWQGEQLLQMQQQQRYSMAALSTRQGVGSHQQQYPAAAMAMRPQQHGQRQGMPGNDPLVGPAGAAGPSFINYGPAGLASGPHAAAGFQPPAAAGVVSTSTSNSSLVMQPVSIQAGLQAQLLLRQQANTFSGPLMAAAPTSGTLSAPLLYMSPMLPSQGISGTLSAVDGSTGLSAEALAGVLHQLSMYECSVEDL